MTPPPIVNKGYQHLDGTGNDDGKGGERRRKAGVPSPRLVARESAGVLHFALYRPSPGDHAPALFPDEKRGRGEEQPEGSVLHATYG